MSNVGLSSICEQLSERIGVCPKCGCLPQVIAVFDNNESNEVIGFRVICECNTDGNDTITEEQITKLPIYSVDDLSKLFRN